MTRALVCLLVLTGCYQQPAPGTGQGTADTQTPDENPSRGNGPERSPDRSNCTLIETIDAGPEGVIDQATVTVWNTDGYVMQLDETNLDGAWKAIASDWEGSCRVRQHTLAEDRSGTRTDALLTQACDSSGQVESRDLQSTTTDSGGQGSSAHSFTVYDRAINAEGQVESELSTVYQVEEGQQVFSSSYLLEYQYNSDGRLSGYDGSDPATGTVDLRVAYDWTDEGSLGGFRIDYPTTGQWVQSTYAYDVYGRIVLIETELGPEAARSLHTREWDPEHYRTLRRSWDREDDGSIDEDWVYVCEGDFPWTCTIDVIEDGVRVAAVVEEYACSD